MSLSYEDFAILLVLESNPFMPMTELAQKLNISRITAKKRVDKLKKNGILRKPIAIYNPHPLGLKRVNILATTPSSIFLTKLQKACDEHPYTHYRAPIFGGVFGLFMQFDIPPHSETLLEEYFHVLQNKGIISDFWFYYSTGIRAESFADLSRFNIKLSSWNFSWEEWFKSLVNAKSNLPERINPESDFTKFNLNYFKILRLLSCDGELKQTDIMAKLNMSRTQTHRDYNYVMDNFIQTIRFMYNREIFGLSETYIAFAENVPNKLCSQLYYAIINDPPPFRLSLDISSENKIHLWANMTPIQISNFSFSLWKELSSLKIYFLDSKKSEMYWFYYDNFDFSTFQWKTSREYMVKNPIERLNL